MSVLALKLLLAPLLVVASSLAGRRLGPRLAGILVVLPINRVGAAAALGLATAAAVTFALFLAVRRPAEAHARG
jgi:hypothetical protein